jgi:predicted lipoprotein with Yx(FWY)xxD motif
MARHTTRVAAYSVAAAALATVLAACGSSSGSSGGTQAVSPAAGGGNAPVTSKSTSIGTVATDANGHTVYELNGNPASDSKCSGSCQSIWPPVMSGGSVKVVNGHPLHTFSGDSAAGQTHGQGVSDTWGTWNAVSPNGTPIAVSGSGSAPSSPPASSGGSGGGYGY